MKICSSQGLSLKATKATKSLTALSLPLSDCQPDGKVCKDCTSETNDTNLAASKWFQLCAGYGSSTLNINQKPPVEMLVVSTCWGQEAKNQGGMSIGGQCGTDVQTLVYFLAKHIFRDWGKKHIQRYSEVFFHTNTICFEWSMRVGTCLYMSAATIASLLLVCGWFIGLLIGFQCLVHTPNK